MPQKTELQICLGSSCFSRGNRDVVNFIREYIRSNNLSDKVVLRGARCMGQCSNGPNLVVNGAPVEDVTISKIEAMFEKEFGKIK